MSCPSDYAVHGPDRHPEITGLVPISQQDERLPNQGPPRSRKRKDRSRPDDPPDAPEAADEQAPPPDRAGEGDHVVDALA